MASELSSSRFWKRIRATLPTILMGGLMLALPGTARAQVSKGHLILMDRGLQVQGMVTVGDVFHLSTYSNANFTSINWLWEANPSLMGAAPGFLWSRWVGDETNMAPQGGEAPYLSQLVSLQLADEWNLNDATTRTRAVNWFNAVSNSYPNTILYANNYGGQVSDAALGDFITRARPDMLCFDTYPFRSDYVTRDPIGGPPTSWYGDLRRYRQWAIDFQIPLATYVQTFHAVQDYDQTVYRDPSPSELRLNTFAALAFNAKTLIGFTYNTGASSLFTNNAGGDNAPNALYAEQADVNLHARNFGKALVRLKPVADTNAYTTSMMIIRGKDSGGSPTPVPIGFLADPQAPNGYTDWAVDRNDPYLRGWSVTNTADTKNGGQPGDVIIAWFKPLDESMDGTEHTNETYMMVVNALTDPTGTAADCLQEIKLNFLNAFTALELLDPATGQLQSTNLPIVTTRRQLVLNLNGGDAALFKFADGAPFVGITRIRAQLAIAMQGSTPAVSVRGAVGSRYRLEFKDSLAVTNWTALTNLLLPASPQVYTDPAASNLSNRVYRAVSPP